MAKKAAPKKAKKIPEHHTRILKGATKTQVKKETKAIRKQKQAKNSVWQNNIVNIGRGLGTGKGNPRAIETPEKLWELFLEYVEWSKANPYKKHIGVVKGKKVYEDRERVLTFIGFEGWLCINEIVYDLAHYESTEKGTDYRPTILRIRKTCSNDTVTGASAGVYNAMIAVRLESLVEKTEVKVDDNRKHVSDLFPLE